MPQPRVPAGVPTGGQFAPVNRPEATGVELSDEQPTTKDRLAALAPYCAYGPEYRRNVVVSLQDYRHFAHLGEPDHAEHYLLVAEMQAGVISEDELVERDPFARISRGRRRAQAVLEAEQLGFHVDDIPVSDLQAGDVVWSYNGFVELTESRGDAVSAGQVVARCRVRKFGASTGPVWTIDFAPNDVAFGRRASSGSTPAVPETPVAQGAAAVERIFPDGEPLADRRGHLLLPVQLAEELPGLYQTEGVPVAEKIVHAHYFLGSADWYVCELDPETGEMFGYCDLDLGFPEWGYSSIKELAELQGPLGTPVERDLDFTPRSAREIGIAP